MEIINIELLKSSDDSMRTIYRLYKVCRYSTYVINFKIINIIEPLNIRLFYHCTGGIYMSGTLDLFDKAGQYSPQEFINRANDWEDPIYKIIYTRGAQEIHQRILNILNNCCHHY